MTSATLPGAWRRTANVKWPPIETPPKPTIDAQLVEPRQHVARVRVNGDVIDEGAPVEPWQRWHHQPPARKSLDLRLPQPHAHRKCEAEEEYARSRGVARLHYQSSFSKGMR